MFLFCFCGSYCFTMYVSHHRLPWVFESMDMGSMNPLLNGTVSHKRYQLHFPKTNNLIKFMLKTLKDCYLIVSGIHDGMIAHLPQFHTVIIQSIQLKVFDPQLWRCWILLKSLRQHTQCVFTVCCALLAVPFTR